MKSRPARAVEQVRIAETMSDALDKDHWIVLRSKAAISAATGLSDEARALAERAIIAVEREKDIPSGIADAIKTDLSELLQKFENAPVVPDGARTFDRPPLDLASGDAGGNCQP